MLLRLDDHVLQQRKAEVVARLAYEVAHDFINVLTSIAANASLIEDSESLSESSRASLLEIRDAVRRGTDLSRRVLGLGRGQPFRQVRIDASDAVSKAAKLAQRLMRDDVRCEVHLHPSPLIVDVDASAVDQIVLNLALNARDAMPGGGSLIISTCERFLDADEAAAAGITSGHYACIRVSDTGVGISPEVLPRIFEQFYTTKVDGGGTGMGLAIVRDALERHRGGVRIESTPGCGTVFSIFLPLAERRDPTAPEPV